MLLARCQQPLSSPRTRTAKIVVAALALLVMGGAARADLALCNKTSSRIGVAIGYQDDKGWMTEGWWNVAAGTCPTLLRGSWPSRFMYFYAIDYERGGEWSGTNYMCTGDKVFAIRDVKDCQRRGHKRTGFIEVDTGNAKEWTIWLTDPEGSGAKNR